LVEGWNMNWSFRLRAREWLSAAILLSLGLLGAQSAAFAASPAPTEKAAIAATIAETPAPQPGSAVAPSGEQQPQSQIFPASGSLLGQPPPRTVSKASIGESGEITLNFINADVKDVAKAVLGDYLKLNYEIAANVQGPVTIQTSRPLPRTKVLAILDQTLRLNGMAIVLTNDVYKVVAADDAARESMAVNPVSSRHQRVAGYGVEVAPVKYISALEMQKLLEPLAPSKAIVHVDTARNVLLIEGTEQERQTLLDDIALFDSDWLAGMTFALYTPIYMDDQELEKELTQILGGMNSPAANVVRLVPIDRLNAVLAISPQPRYLEQLKAWVARLDRPGQGTDKRIFVYAVQHGRATDLAGTLAKTLFGGAAAAESSQSTASASTQNASVPSSSSSGSVPMAAEGAPVSVGQASVSGTSAGGLAGIRINADETNNALVILATPQQYARVQEALAQLDLAPLQVFLEAAIAEVTLGDKLQYGVQYFAQSGSNQFVLSSSNSSDIAPTFPGFSYLFTTSNIKIILDGLSTITHVEVLSSPQLMVLNNQTATLQVGDQVPIITQQAVSTLDQGAPIVNSVQYQNTGVILKVTPRVNRSGEVMMDISQEVSDVTTTTSSSIQSPTIQQRKISSSVAIQDGETVALGGLITRNLSQTKSGIPFVQELPLVGELFRDTQNSQGKTELMVLITPHVVDNLQKARAVTEELRRRLPNVQPLFEDAR
jgi:general secretion pathway protein D